jgi:hypothetical protein
MPDLGVQAAVPASEPRLEARCNSALRRLPRKMRLALLAGSFFALACFLYAFLSSGSATLNVVCRHSFRSAELSVFVDGKLNHSEQISGIAKKRFGLFDTRVEGSFSKSLAVPAGEHLVQVRLRSATDGFDQTKQCRINLPAGKDATVVVSTQRGAMSLAYQGPAAGTETASGYFNSLRTVVVTVLGSAVSAAIGFVVQDFLRSRKVSFPVQNS